MSDGPRFRVHHVSISVADMAEACAFYRRFGFRETFEYKHPDGSVSITHLKLGETLLEIFCYRNHHPPPRSAAELVTDLPRVGIKHFALQVESIEDARHFVADSGLAPVPPEITEGRTGIRYFFIKDPSGNLLEIVEDRRPS
ncbi:glyoxylase I family protein [Krasilnikovia cinnamomea]|uniref:Glyoxylase I family protein n=1 Tax=Krasilnikovia cinnamomea TaxID=349313 RepID=A0A4Q7ZEG9_9ACTN|nr:VOC family protein [Krasilnikovia cinnamomea]RZU49058.1 glyoxylase I family protein [Krasilnikovia cinnamomea]